LPAQHALFADIAHLASCEPLAPLGNEEADFELRTLVRLEAARRGRLGEAAASAPTIWKDVLSRDFFLRSTLPPELVRADLIAWPVEAEAWPGETLRIGSLPWRCDAPAPAAADELSIASAEFIERLGNAASSSPLIRRVASRVAYHRA